MSSRSCLNVALCGLGRMGLIHFENCVKNSRVQLLYIVEVDMDKANRIIKENHFQESVTAIHVDNIDKMFADANLDAVIIATPTQMHGEIIQKAIDANKHVLCEKPLSLNLKQVMTYYKLAKDKGLALLCAFNRRFDPQIRELVESKDQVGNLYTLRICSRDSPRPSISYLKGSGGIFHDCLVHDVDVGRWIVGEDPETVYATAHCHDPEIAEFGDVDTVFATLKFPSGVLMVIEAQRECVYGYDQTVEIYGSQGNMTSGNLRKSGLLRNGRQKLDDIYFSFNDRYAEAYRAELDHFVDLAQNKVSTPFITQTDTLQATLLSQAAADSWKEKRVIDFKTYSKELLVEYGLSDC